MQQPSQRQPEPLPEARLVADGIWKLTVPIPFPLRTVNMHAIVGDNGDWVLVDTGMGTPDARAALTAGLEKAGLGIDHLRAIVLTHHHPDHVGMSGELYERSGAVVYMHPIDEASVQIIWSGTMPRRFRRVSDFFAQHGVPETNFWYTQVDPDAMRRIISVPPHEAFTMIEDGEHLDLLGERYRVIWVPGHADGQIVLFRERDGVFLAADHVLPRITPNIGLYSTHDRPNPLADYLDSLRKVENLPATVVLPGHGEPFADLSGRVNEIIEHHGQREMQIIAMLDEGPQNAYQIAVKLFGHRMQNSEAQRMAVAEALSHLEHLRIGGQVDQYRTEDGIVLYSAA